MDEGIKKLLTQMDLLQEHMKENLEKQKGTCEVLRT